MADDIAARYAAEAANFREAAKWIVGSFSALAAAIVGASSFSDIGAMELGLWLCIATAAIVAALGLVSWVIFLCGAVLTPRPLTRADLGGNARYATVKRWVDQNVGPTLPGGSVDGLLAEYAAAELRVAEAAAAGNQALLTDREAQLDKLQDHVTNVMEAVKLRSVSTAFESLLTVVKLSIVPIAVLLYVFLWLTTNYRDQTESIDPPEARGFARTPYAEAVLKAAGLPESCLAPQMTVILTKTAPLDGVDGLVVPTGPNCPVVHLRIADPRKFGITK